MLWGMHRKHGEGEKEECAMPCPYIRGEPRAMTRPHDTASSVSPATTAWVNVSCTVSIGWSPGASGARG